MNVHRALSIRQPYAELILREIKIIEYRSRPTNIRERVYIYASQTPADDPEGFEKLVLSQVIYPRFFFNQWWNPSANDQAKDRVVRTGQRKRVGIYRFRSRNTVEEGLEVILRRKRAISHDIVDRIAIAGENVVSNVASDHELRILATKYIPTT